MSSIAEKIKQKLEAFEQYNYQESEEKNTYLSESEEEEKFELEPLNIENVKRHSEGFTEQKNEFIQNYLNEQNIELSENLKSSKNFGGEKNSENNLIFLENDLNYKINEYVTNKLSQQGLLSPNSDCNSKKARIRKQSSPINKENRFNLNINNNNNLNFQTNYSTNYTQNIDSNGKTSNFNYIELGNSCEESFDYGEDSINASSENSKILNSLKQEEKTPITKKASGSADSKKNEGQRSSNYNDNTNFTLRKITSLGNKDPREKDESFRDFNEIYLKEPESFFYQKLEDNHDNKFKRNAVEESNSSIINDKSICRRIIMPTFYFLEEFIFVTLMVLLLILDPMIILTLKIADFTYEQMLKCFSNKNKYSKIDNFNVNNINNNHLLFCGEIEEIDINNLDNFSNHNDNVKKHSLYEKYFNYFFNNCVYKNQRNIIKTCFIAIALLMNFYILTSVQEKATKLLLFFLNNLYLLYHTMDLYNEKLLNYTENLGWFKIINRI